MWSRNNRPFKSKCYLLAEPLNGSVGGCAVFGFHLGQASFFWKSSQARPRISATKIAKIPPEAHRLK